MQDLRFRGLRLRASGFRAYRLQEGSFSVARPQNFMLGSSVSLQFRGFQRIAGLQLLNFSWVQGLGLQLGRFEGEYRALPHPKRLQQGQQSRRSMYTTIVQGLMGFRVQGYYTTIVGSLSLIRVHVPKQQILRPQSTYIGITLRPKYILFSYMDPQGKSATEARDRKLDIIRQGHRPTKAALHVCQCRQAPCCYHYCNKTIMPDLQKRKLKDS